MGEAFLFGTGGDRLKNAYAIITVAYPAGSTVICSNGTKVLKAGNTYGVWAFAIPGNGTWTVACNDGSKSASKAVEITARGQAENITLMYEWYFFREGEGLGENTIKTLTGGTATVDSGSIKMQSAASGSYGAIISPCIPDIKKYRTLRVQANVGNGYGACQFGLCNNENAAYNELTTGKYIIAKLVPTAKNARDSYSIDLASVSNTETKAYFYTLCPNGAHTTYFYDIVALP